MSDPVDLEAERWKKSTNAHGLNPLSALKAAIRAIESGEQTPSHVIIVMGTSYEDGGCSLSYMNAGAYDSHGQIGLLSKATHNLMTDMKVICDEHG